MQTTTLKLATAALWLLAVGAVATAAMLGVLAAAALTPAASPALQAGAAATPAPDPLPALQADDFRIIRDPQACGDVTWLGTARRDPDARRHFRISLRPRSMKMDTYLFSPHDEWIGRSVALKVAADTLRRWRQEDGVEDEYVLLSIWDDVRAEVVIDVLDMIRSVGVPCVFMKDDHELFYELSWYWDGVTTGRYNQND